MVDRYDTIIKLLTEVGFEKQLWRHGVDSTGYKGFHFGGIEEKGIFKKEFYFYVYAYESFYHGEIERELLKAATHDNCNRCFTKFHSGSNFFNCTNRIWIPIECYKISTVIIDDYTNRMEDYYNRERKRGIREDDEINMRFEEQLKRNC